MQRERWQAFHCPTFCNVLQPISEVIRARPDKGGGKFRENQRSEWRSGLVPYFISLSIYLFGEGGTK